MTDDRWNARKSGVACPFCDARPDDSDAWSKVASLKVASLYLQKIQTYRGHGVLVFDPRHVTRLTELSADERLALFDDLHVSQQAIERVTRPEHVNVASLGNVVPHLHWHIIPRYFDDARWGGPIWTTKEEEMKVVRLPDEEHRRLVSAIRAELRLPEGQ